MKILGSIKHILGMDVYNNLDEHKVYISQRQYIVGSVKRYSKYNLRVFSTPIDNRQPYMKSQCPEEGLPEALRMLQMPYRELIGTLLWIANGTRPVIAYAVTTLAKYTSNPGEIHWQALLRVLGYYKQLSITSFVIPEMSASQPFRKGSGDGITSTNLTFKI